uniref:Uncharacterized protein n=1 Tax=Cacopsylla melanoneura TaxID=428564 RepID=A0A8D8VUW7_9HEMI
MPRLHGANKGSFDIILFCFSRHFTLCPVKNSPAAHSNHFQSKFSVAGWTRTNAKSIASVCVGGGSIAVIIWNFSRSSSEKFGHPCSTERVSFLSSMAWFHSVHSVSALYYPFYGN